MSKPVKKEPKKPRKGGKKRQENQSDDTGGAASEEEIKVNPIVEAYRASQFGLMKPATPNLSYIQGKYYSNVGLNVRK